MIGSESALRQADGQCAVRWRSTHGLRLLACGSGTIAIEGAIHELDGLNGQAALERLIVVTDSEGPEAISRAAGDFVAFFIFERQVHLYKSFTSQFQAYYASSGVAASNRLAALADVDHIPWNEDYFARHVLIVPGYQHWSEETPLQGIRRVLPGEFVTLDTECRRRQLVRRNYRYVLDDVQRREDVAPQILQLLRDSIRNRLAAHPDAKLCVEISGGLDSSFVASLLGQQASGIRGVMFSQPNVPSHVVSEGFARDVAQAHGIDLVIVAPDDLPKGADEDAGYSDEPSDFFWFGDMFSRAVSDVAQPGSLVFTGYGADQLFLRSPAFLPYLLRRGRFKLFKEALAPASALLSRGQINVAWQSALSLLPETLHHGLMQRMKAGLWNPWVVDDVNMQRMLTSDVSWVRCGRGLASYEIERHLLEAEHVGNGIICDDWGYFSAPRTVTQPAFAPKQLTDASPFCDLPLLDFMYENVSALLVHDFNGRYKELLRECQKGIVPENLRSRRSDTFVFNSFQLDYFRSSRALSEELLRSVPDDWISIPDARRALDELEFGLTSSSTRSVVALIGYLRWRRVFMTCARAFRTSLPDNSFVAEIGGTASAASTVARRM